uniref:DNA helicase n=1 Tax=Cucumis melo TaxID=3656 RepID=A0A9I9EMD3_CUCME
QNPSLLQNPYLSFFPHTPFSFFKIPPLTNDERRTMKTPFFSSPHPFFSTTETHSEETHIVAGGVMVLADGGVVCIDEFDKMRSKDRSGSVLPESIRAVKSYLRQFIDV